MRAAREKNAPTVKDVLKEYRIHFFGLAPGEHVFEYHVGQDLFERFGYRDTWSEADIHVRAKLTKGGSVMELALDFRGEITVPCDATGEIFRLPVSGNENLLVKQDGAAAADQDDQIIALAREETTIDIAQHVYEMIVLNIPQKRHHPDYLAGKLKPSWETPEHETPSAPETDREQAVDPRWEKLKDIKLNA